MQDLTPTSFAHDFIRHYRRGPQMVLMKITRVIVVDLLDSDALAIGKNQQGTRQIAFFLDRGGRVVTD